MPTTVIKSPTEAFSIGFPYANKLPVGVTIASGEVFASRMGTWQATTLASLAAVGAVSLSLTADVGRGAWLIIGTGATQERVKVSTLSGGGPYSAGIQPALTYAHAAGEAVSYEPGVTILVLGSSVATLADSEARVLLQNGVYGQRLRVTMTLTLDNGDVLEDTCIVVIRG